MFCFQFYPRVFLLSSWWVGCAWAVLESFHWGLFAFLFIYTFIHQKTKLQTMLTLTTKHKQLAAKIYEFTITNWKHIRSFWSNFHSFILYTRITPYIYTHTHAQKRLTKSRKNLYLKLVIRLTIWQLNILTQWNKIQLVIPIQKI